MILCWRASFACHSCTLLQTADTCTSQPVFYVRDSGHFSVTFRSKAGCACWEWCLRKAGLKQRLDRDTNNVALSLLIFSLPKASLPLHAVCLSCWVWPGGAGPPHGVPVSWTGSASQLRWGQWKGNNHTLLPWPAISSSLRYLHSSAKSRDGIMFSQTQHFQAGSIEVFGSVTFYDLILKANFTTSRELHSGSCQL